MIRLYNRHVICSGYFNPLGPHHIDYFHAARKLGDYLIVIVNNDEQVNKKGSCPFLSEKDRLKLVSAIRWVDYTVLSIDTDNSVAKTLRALKDMDRFSECPFIFANGGDRAGKDNQAIAEEKTCNEIGCEIVYGVGGFNKSNSSSYLIKNAVNWYRKHRE